MKKQQVINNINPLVLKGIAHRGLWNEELTENGIPAFQNAIVHNVAFELDIHLTKDNQLLVCHDSELYRTTGKKGIIEDLTLAEIKENYRLHDGSSLPTLEEVLALTSERVPIIIELKAYQICDKGTGYHISIDCSRLHNGEYILYINVGGNIESEKISIRQ